MPAVLKVVAASGLSLTGSPSFTGSAGSGESEYRRYILEADLLEAIIALPNDTCPTTPGLPPISGYSVIKKPLNVRKAKGQLINASNLNTKMRKSLGSKRNHPTGS